MEELVAWNGAKRCSATSKSTGGRCGKLPIPGGNVCVMHGGSVPQVREAAKLRLLAMVEPVMSAFEEILESWRRTKCEACGHPTGDPAPVIKVGQLVLDRSGFHPSVTVEQAPKANPYDGLSEDELIERLERTLDVAKQARDERRLQAAPIEGHLIEEGEDLLSMPQVDSTMPPDDDHKPLKTKDLPHD